MQIKKIISDELMFQRSRRIPLKTQKAKLRSILERNKDTEYGKKFNFASIQNIKEFQDHIPIVTYSKVEPYIERMKKGEVNILTKERPRYFLTTSGTTGRAKYIPLTHTFLKEHVFGNNIWAFHLFRDHPSVFTGKILHLVGSSFDKTTEAEIPCGSISGYFAELIPSYLKRLLVIPNQLYNIKELEEKYYLIARLALEKNITAIVAGTNPGMIFVLFDIIEQMKDTLVKEIYDGSVSKEIAGKEVLQLVKQRIKPNPKRAKELEKILNRRRDKFLPKFYWPNLKVVSCSRAGFAKFFLNKFPNYIGKIPIRGLGYVATEGRGSICISDEGAGGVLATNSHFFEFIPEEEIEKSHPTALTCDQLKTNESYYILITASNGLCRYNIKDVVTVKGYYKNTPIIEFKDRGDNTLSIAGEKITEEQIIKALSVAAKETTVIPKAFIATYGWEDILPHYIFLVEFSKQYSSSKLKQFLKSVDKELGKQNIAYHRKRVTLKTLEAPVLHRVNTGGFFDFYKQKIKQGAHDTQVKQIFLSKDPDIINKFQIVKTYGLEEKKRA